MRSRHARTLGLVGAGLAAVAIVAAPAFAATTVTNVASGSLDARVHLKTHPRQDTRVVVANVNLPERGDIITWHTHPGPTLGVVTGGGTLTIVTDDCEHHVVRTGESFIAPERIHTARNLSGQPVTVRATFIIPADQPPTIIEPPAVIARLDTKCGF